MSRLWHIVFTGNACLRDVVYREYTECLQALEMTASIEMAAWGRER